jgi:hypothetical protein
MASTKFTPSPSLCSKDPRNNFSSEDVSTNKDCVCPEKQGRFTVFKAEQVLSDGKKYFRCQKGSAPVSVGTSSSGSSGSSGSGNRRNSGSNSSGSSESVETCSLTPYNTSNPSNWSSSTTNSSCSCPSPLKKDITNIDNKTYYTCSY